jgi:hypothetical protein
MALGAVPLTASPAAASLAAVGPVSEVNGFPEYFEDASGLRLRLCDNLADGCTMAIDIPDANAPLAFPTNYPGESFYFAAAADTVRGAYEAALEATFTDGTAAVGENILFGRIRIRLDDLQANARYTITHPYGVLNLTADAGGRINYTDDQGCMAAPCGAFAAAQTCFVGDASATSMNFLTSPTFDPATAVEGTEIGDPVTAGPVVGSPFGTNFLRVEGPNAGGTNINVAQTSVFTLEGQVAAPPSANRPSTPDLAATSDTGRVDTDNITNDTTPTFTGRATTGPVELLVDGVVAATAEATDGTYTVTPTAALTPGNRRISVRTPDPASDPTAPTTLTSGTLNMQLDTTVPPVAINTPRPTNGTVDATPTFQFSSTEAGSTFECSLTPGTEAVERPYEECTSPLTYDDQAPGTYTFRVRATDAAGNVGAPASYKWAIGTIDSTPPTAQGAPTGTAVSVGSNVTATFSEAVLGVDETTFTLKSAAGNVPAAVTYDSTRRVATLDPTAALEPETTYTATLSGGTTAIRDTAVNPLGATTWTFTTAPAVDVTPPPAPAIDPATGTYTSAQSVTMTDSEAGAVIRYTVGTGTTVPADPTATSTLYTGAINVGSSRVIKAAAFDAAGNRSDITQRNYTINLPDTTAPSVPTGVTATGASTTSITVRWTGSTDNVGVTGYRVYADGVTTPTATVTTGTSYTHTSLAVGSTHSYQVAAIDAAGNESAKTTAVSGTTTSASDGLPPPAPTVNPATGTYTTAQSVTMSDTEAGAVIRYTVGTGTTVPADPTATSTQYTGAISVNSSQVIKAAAFDAAGNRSTITQRNYTIAGGRTLVLNPVADVTASQASPTTTAGTATSLKSDQEATDGD